MLTIQTASGKSFEIFNCGSIGNMLYITFLNANFLDIAKVFSDQSESGYIQYYIDGSIKKVFSGYTHLCEILERDNSNVSIRLERPEGE